MLVTCIVALPALEMTKVLCALVLTGTFPKLKLPLNTISPLAPVQETAIVFTPPTASDFTVAEPL